MSRLHAAARSSGWVLAAKGGERLVRLVVVVVLARLLGPRGFGVYALAFAIAEVFAVFTDFGLQPVVVREIARDRGAAPRVLGAALLLKVGLAAVSWVVASAVVVGTLPAGETRWSALVATFALFVSFRIASLRTVFDAPFEAELRMGLPSAAAAASEVLSGLCIIAAAWARWPIPALVGVQLAALAPGAVFLVRASLREVRPVLRPAPRLWGRLLAAALPIGVANLCLIGYTRSDILMIEWMRGSSEVGLYTAAYRLPGSLQIIPLALTTSLLPLMSTVRASAEPERLRRIYRGAFSLVMAAALPVGVFLSVLAGGVIAWLYGPAFAPAAGTLVVLGWAEVFSFVLYVLTTAAVAIGRERWFMAYAALLVALNVGLNALLIPPFGIIGAGWATFLAEGALLLAALWVLRPALGLPSGRAAARALGAGAAAWAALVWLPAPLPVQLAVGAAVYAALVLGGGGLTPEGIAALGSLLRRGTDRQPKEGG